MKSKFSLCITYNEALKQSTLEYTKFPGGELQPKIILEAPAKTVWINALIKDSDGLLMLALVKDILDRHEVDKIKLDLHYMPYARQDRVCNAGEAFGLKVIANFINSLKFDEVMVTDPHSDVTVAVLDNCAVQDQVSGFLQANLGLPLGKKQYFKDYFID